MFQSTFAEPNIQTTSAGSAVVWCVSPDGLAPTYRATYEDARDAEIAYALSGRLAFSEAIAIGAHEIAAIDEGGYVALSA